MISKKTITTLGTMLIILLSLPTLYLVFDKYILGNNFESNHSIIIKILDLYLVITFLILVILSPTQRYSYGIFKSSYVPRNRSYPKTQVITNVFLILLIIRVSFWLWSAFKRLEIYEVEFLNIILFLITITIGFSIIYFLKEKLSDLKNQNKPYIFLNILNSLKKRFDNEISSKYKMKMLKKERDKLLELDLTEIPQKLWEAKQEAESNRILNKYKTIKSEEKVDKILELKAQEKLNRVMELNRKIKALEKQIKP